MDLDLEFKVTQKSSYYNMWYSSPLYSLPANFHPFQKKGVSNKI